MDSENDFFNQKSEKLAAAARTTMVAVVHQTQERARDKNHKISTLDETAFASFLSFSLQNISSQKFQKCVEEYSFNLFSFTSNSNLIVIVLSSF